MPAGVYNVQVVLSGVTAQVTSAPGVVQTVDLQSQQAIKHMDYGIHLPDTAWHNTRVAEDVNDDGTVSAIDALLIINLINSNTPSALIGSNLSSPPFIDVSNDAFLTSLDALLVINAINAAGEGEVSSGASLVTTSGSGGSEGESDTACQPYEFRMTDSLVASSPPEGEFVGPVQLMRTNRILPIEVSSADTEGESEHAGSASDCVIEQLASDQSSLESQPVADSGYSIQDIELIRRLQANPWSLPQPCHCPECMSFDLAQSR